MRYDHEQVKQILPHRDPMLLIDTVSEIEPGVRVTASLWIDPAREIFRGHFPEEAVLPGVYTIEAMAQATDLVLMTKPEYAGKVPLLLGADKARFYKKIIPGDTLEIHAEMAVLREDKAIGTCSCTVSVDGEKAASADVTIAMR
ncbi:MAG: 3-hydroxyacyl-ACP dehydratase FabZ [Firmicutes bacterium]|nr:3-hydroxyacyl-ACP dehydratase FabZ [Bacillota bacterium]